MASFTMEIEGLPEFRAKLKDFPIDGEKRMGKIADRLSKRLRNQMRTRGFQSGGAASVKIGPGKGPRGQYSAHARDSIKGHGGAINWGMYIRVGLSKKKAGYLVVIWNELGTEDRYRGGRSRGTGESREWRPHSTNKTGKPGYTGILRARHMIETEGRVIIASAHFYVAEVEKALEAACKD